ncbi:MAG TPA: LPS export ABC transporter periplasmic protein LptC [Rhizobiales bacterium]|nr:LPS export ABC transporter periplasmic protein LptC [Hyphomicrobiales bacterium]
MTTESAATLEARQASHRKSQIDPERRRAFADARIHSRIVRFLKIALPAAAVTMIGGFAVHSWMAAPVVAAVDVRETKIVSGKLVMAAPKLEGFTKDNLAYSLSAERAVQAIGKANVFELEGIDARLPVDANTWAVVKAKKGVYDRDRNTIDFKSEVGVSTTDGMAATFASAFYDIGKGELKTSDPVEINMNGTQIAADGMTVLENGKVLIFENRVRMDIAPGQLRGGEEGGGANGG